MQAILAIIGDLGLCRNTYPRSRARSLNRNEVRWNASINIACLLRRNQTRGTINGQERDGLAWGSAEGDEALRLPRAARRAPPVAGAQQAHAAATRGARGAQGPARRVRRAAHHHVAAHRLPHRLPHRPDARRAAGGVSAACGDGRTACNREVRGKGGLNFGRVFVTLTPNPFVHAHTPPPEPQGMRAALALVSLLALGASAFKKGRVVSCNA